MTEFSRAPAGSVNMECLVYFSISQGYPAKTNTNIILMEALKTFKLKKNRRSDTKDITQHAKYVGRTLIFQIQFKQELLKLLW